MTTADLGATWHSPPGRLPLASQGFFDFRALAVRGPHPEQRTCRAGQRSQRTTAQHHGAPPGRLLRELEARRVQLDRQNFLKRDEVLRQVIVYYTNNKGKMGYPQHLKRKLPLGSGVTEAACKTVVKQRMCVSGSRWKDGGASCVLALRTLKLTSGRWRQFWSYVTRHGCTPC